MSKAFEIGTDLVKLCREGKNDEAVQKWYSPNIKSIEAAVPEGRERIQTGLEAVKEKEAWWNSQFEVTRNHVEGPFPAGDHKRFSVFFDIDVKDKKTGEVGPMKEVALYTVDGDKIVEEEFFYHMG